MIGGSLNCHYGMDTGNGRESLKTMQSSSFYHCGICHGFGNFEINQQ